MVGASPDGFYLALPNHGCKEPIEIIIDNASQRCQFVADGVLKIVCPSRGHTGPYQSKNVLHYLGQHALGEN